MHSCSEKSSIALFLGLLGFFGLFGFSYMHLHPKAFSLALGTFWGIGIAFMAMVSMVFDYGTVLVELLGTVYVGLGPSVPGMIAGFLWGFVDGAVCGYLIALLYNHFLTKGQSLRR